MSALVKEGIVSSIKPNIRGQVRRELDREKTAVQRAVTETKLVMPLMAGRRFRISSDEIVPKL
ncbi:MAG: hypothetical protein NZT61_03310 [Deltaproteobacteria bacterium]|nr:hypothetical protein [Deltaproteobacteria bacterium]